jgi:hypothetical protein
MARYENYGKIRQGSGCSLIKMLFWILSGGTKKTLGEFQ